MLAHVQFAIDGNTIGAAKIKNGKLSIWLILDLSMIARDAFVFNDDIIAELTTNVDHRFLNAVNLVTSLGELNRKPGRRQRQGLLGRHWWRDRGTGPCAGLMKRRSIGVGDVWQLLSRRQLCSQERQLL